MMCFAVYRHGVLNLCSLLLCRLTGLSWRRMRGGVPPLLDSETWGCTALAIRRE